MTDTANGHYQTKNIVIWKSAFPLSIIVIYWLSGNIAENVSHLENGYSPVWIVS